MQTSSVTVALLFQASSSEAMGRWLGVLLAETGSTTDPATLHYDYIDVETTANVIQLAKQSFWWERNTKSNKELPFVCNWAVTFSCFCSVIQ